MIASFLQVINVLSRITLSIITGDLVTQSDLVRFSKLLFWLNLIKVVKIDGCNYTHCTRAYAAPVFIDQTANCDLQYAFLLCCCHKKAQFPLVFISDTAVNVLESCLLLFVWQCSYRPTIQGRRNWGCHWCTCIPYFLGTKVQNPPWILSLFVAH